MSALQTLRELTRILGLDEKKTIRSYLFSFDSRGDEFQSKSLRLFDYLCKEKTPAKDREVEHFMYGKSEPFAWPKLLARLREKMLDALTLPVNITRLNVYDERSRQLFLIRRKLMRIQFLSQRNCIALAELEIESVLELTEEIEAWEERLAVLQMRIEMLNRLPDLIKKGNVFPLLNQLIHCVQQIQQTSLAEMLLYRIDQGELLTDDISFQELRRIINAKPRRLSSEGTINREQLKAYDYLFIRYEPEKAVNCLFKALRIIKKHPLVKPGGYEGLIEVRLAEALLHQRRFRFAFEEAHLALPFLPEHPHVQIRAHELKFFAQCYMSDFHEAREIIEVFDSKFPLNTPQRFCWMGYVYFAIGSFGRAQEMIEKMLMAKPRKDLTPGMLVLVLMNAAEQREEEPEQEDAVDKLYHKIKRGFTFGSDANVMPREQIILKILFQLHKNHFSFKETHQTAHELLEQLNQPANQWKFLSDELIPFEEWFLMKTAKMDRDKAMRMIDYKKR